ncbi:MAG: GNAT family N-acetyltransferase [Bacteriovoracaceae bacterium]|jgi:GNAT superfamily N-acetyltransferase|nr:GNAT family N-acetyltransferase [Bacteriovoracaceae bacterium]
MDNYSVKILTSEEFKPLYDKHRKEIFEKDHSYVLWDLLDEDELSNIKKLGKRLGNPFKLYLAAYDSHENFIGWSWGFQDNNTDFYMCNSAVLPNYRRKGVYSTLLKKCLEVLKEEGFQMVYSKHCVTNNDVIIPKLREGFLISKMELDDKFGILIHLHYYMNPTRKKIMDYRAGQLKPDGKIKSLFKI